MVWKSYTGYMMNHSKCDHPATKSARAECRRQKSFEVADRVAMRTFHWVAKARQEGYTNRIHRITLDEMAQEMGIREYDYELAERLVVSKVKSLKREDMLGDDMLPKAIRHHA